ILLLTVSANLHFILICRPLALRIRGRFAWQEQKWRKCMRYQLNRLGICLVTALIVCLFHGQNASAQTAASIVGDVTDANGAGAPNVTATVIHEGTKIERQVLTNEAGQYRVTPLNPGTYTIEVQASGFKRAMRSGVVLEVAAVLE